MSRIAGVKYLGIAPINKSGLKETYEAPIELKQFVSFSATKNYSETSWYSNDQTEETFNAIVDEDIEIVLGHLSGDLRAKLSGANYDDKGVMTEKSDDEQAEFGLIVVLSQLPKGTLNKAYYRVKLKVESTEGETKTDSINDSTVTLSGKAIPNSEGIICRTIDSTDENADSTVVSKWTTAVYVPTE